MKYTVVIFLALLATVQSCEDKFVRNCKNDRLAYEAPDSISESEYVIYHFLLNEKGVIDHTFIMQQTTMIPVDVLIEYATHYIDTVMLNNYDKCNNESSNLDPKLFEDIHNICIVPKSEFEIVTTEYDWIPLSFTRVGFNTDSTEALVSYMEESGFRTFHLNYMEEDWIIIWTSGGGDD